MRITDRIIERFSRVDTKGTFENAEPNDIDEFGIDETETKKCGFDFVDKVPHIINRTLKNFRWASDDPQVKGILADLITKSNSEFHLEGDKDAVKYLEKRCKEWNISNVMDTIYWTGMVDGEGFINRWIKNNKVQLRFLTVDGENYKMKRVYDEVGDILGYVQKVLYNDKTNKGWMRKYFDELEKDEVEKEFKFQPDEIINYKYFEVKGKGKSLLEPILDDVYYKHTLKRLMPKIVHKTSNITHVTMGNEDVSSKRLTKQDREKIEEILSNPNSEGTPITPYGIGIDLKKGGALLDVPTYLKWYEREIFFAMNTPEAIFSSESSNRATADIQLDSPTSGRVLFLQYNQEWMKKIIEEEIFRVELDLNGYQGKEVEIVFNRDLLITNPEEEESETNKKPITKKGSGENPSSGYSNSSKSNKNREGV